MARFSSAYKQTGPTRRIVQGEDSFEKGMYWTNSAAGQGYVHTLLNYEIDQLSYDVHVAGGLHVTDVAAGCTYLDRATFGTGDANIVVLQGRNEYNLRAFEGITNIISANKLTIKNNQTLEEKLRQQGFTADDVVCYKLLTYNPINHRLMSVTLIQAKRDKYFVVDNKYQLRRINSNPISCGFSEVWETVNGENYVSNRLNYHPDGADDNYIPRARRNSYDETFGQKLHSSLYMQTVPNCEGYGNKTFCFTKKKLIDLEGEIKDTTIILYKDVIEVSKFNWGDGKGFHLDDLIVIQTIDPTKTVTPHKMRVVAIANATKNNVVAETQHSIPSGTSRQAIRTQDDWNHIAFGNKLVSKATLISGTVITLGSLSEGTITVQYDNSTPSTPLKYVSTYPSGTVATVDIKYVNQTTFIMPYRAALESTGVFEGTNSTYNKNDFEVKYYNQNNEEFTPDEEITWNFTAFIERKIVAGSSTPSNNASQDIYLRHINTGVTELYNASLNGKSVPLDAFRYGIVNTGCALVPTEQAITSTSVTPVSENKLWDTALINLIKPDNNIALFKLNLTDGTIAPTDAAINASTKPNLSFKALPYIQRVTGEPTTVVVSEDIFKVSDGITISNWGSSPEAIHPADFLNENVKLTLRKGQGFRFAAYCTSLKNPNRYLNTLREDPLSSKYYDQEVTTVFVLDYVWNGNSWEFSFIDTSIDMYDSQGKELSLVENWSLNGKDELGNAITRHYIWLNSLAYTDVLTELNINNMANHIVDNYTTKKLIYDKSDNALYTGLSDTLAQDLDETIDNNFPDDTDIINKSKLNDVSYGHFAVTPKNLTPGEAALWGYNMLSNAPYTFECINTPSTGTASLSGILLKSAKDTNKVLLKPAVNTPGVIEIYYRGDKGAFKVAPNRNEGGKAYQLTLEYKNPVDNWRDLKKFTDTETHNLLSTGTPIQIPFTGADETVMIRATLRDLAVTVEVPNETNTATQSEYLVVDQMITTFSFAKDTTKAEPSPETYDLGSATGITYWKGRLVLWGVLNAENMLFMSEPNEPEYFAYPNGVDIFEENIVHVIPYSDALIVFTSTKLWRIDMNADGLSWNKALLQQNLRIVDQDIPYITILKNMLFFKSDKQFYMLVPSKSSTVGELTIAPISKAIKEFLVNPFAALREIVHTIYPDLAGREYTSPMLGTVGVDGELINVPERPITDYLVKYGAHTEQNQIMVDWWFDITEWQNQTADYGDRIVHHDVNQGLTPANSATNKPKQYWLVQLIYDTQTYGWTMRTHITNHIGVFIADAVNQDTDFITLVFSPENTDFGASAKATWGISISHRREPADYILDAFGLGNNQINVLDPAYPRFQVFDTGYKEVSSPSLKKRFREVQFAFEPSSDTKEGLRAAYTAMIDGHTVMSAVSQEVFEETEVDPITGTRTIIKIVDRLNFHDDNLLDPNAPANYVPLPYIVDGQLSNTFVLDSSALAGVKQVKIRRQINGKGYLVRARFVNITHANYSIANYAFVSHNKNAR